MSLIWIILAQCAGTQLASGGTVNVAKSKPVDASSRWKDHGPGLGVDGNTKSVIPHVIITDVGQDFGAWWVDLQTQVRDPIVKIYFSIDEKHRRDGIQVYTSSTPFTTLPPGGQPCYNTGPDFRTVPDFVTVTTCSGTWRHLMIYRQTGDNVLNLGEVEVLVCSTATYGLHCNQSCSSRQCAATPTSCDRYTGACDPAGCKIGWAGTDCAGCSSGLYGANCDKSCSDRQCAVASTTCDRTTGACNPAGCKAGYWQLDCAEACPSGRYGPACNSDCGNCTGDDICNPVTGNCPGDCEAGWWGSQCKETCAINTYGVNCGETCGHCVGTCDKTDGHCPDGCQEGYNGTRCMQTQTLAFTASDVVPVVAGTATPILVSVPLLALYMAWKRRRSFQDNKSVDSQSRVTLNGASGILSVISPNENIVTKMIPSINPQPRANEPVQTNPKLQNSASQEEDTRLATVLNMVIPAEEDVTANRDGNEYKTQEIPVGDVENVVQEIRERGGEIEAAFSGLPFGFMSPSDYPRKLEKSATKKYSEHKSYEQNRFQLSPLNDIPSTDYINTTSKNSTDQKKTSDTAGDGSLDGNRENLVRKDKPKVKFQLNENPPKQIIPNLGNKLKSPPPDGETEPDPKLKVDEENISPNMNDNEDMIQSIFVEDVEGNIQEIKHRSADVESGYNDLPSGLTSPSDDFQRAENTDNHTFTEDYPRDHNRPILSPSTDIPSSDYVGVSAKQQSLDPELNEETADEDNISSNKSTSEDGTRKVEDVEDTEEETKHKEGAFNAEYNPSSASDDYPQKPDNSDTQTLPVYTPWPDNTKANTLQSFVEDDSYITSLVPRNGDLWRMIWEHRCSQIVILGGLEDCTKAKCCLYCPDDDTIDTGLEVEVDFISGTGFVKKYGDVSVTTISQSNLSSDVTMTTAKLQTSDDSPRSIKLYQLNGSPSLDSMSSQLLNNAHLYELPSERTSVVIHCESDLKLAVSFFIMGNILSGIRGDQRVDIISQVKTFLKCCPDLVFTHKDVEKFHKFAKKYMEMTGASPVC